MAQHKLREISIAGYKSIRNARVELGDINILIGANGAGKSNLLSAFGLLHDIIEDRLAVHVVKRGGANTLLHFGTRVTERMTFKLDFGPEGYEAVLTPTKVDTLYFASELWSLHREGFVQALIHSLGEGHTETKLGTAGIPNHVLESIRSWRIFQFHDTGEFARVKQRHLVDDNMFLRPDAKNLAAFLYRIRETEAFHASYRQIVAVVQRVAPFFEDFVLEPESAMGGSILLAWHERGSDEHFNAHTLSDGTLRFICLATLLLQPHSLLPTTILIDEPELGLHPAAIHLLAGMIQSVSQHAQVIISTQSVTLLNQFAPDQVIVVERDKRGSIFRRISADEIATWLDDYSLGELWEKNVLGGRPR